MAERFSPYGSMVQNYFGGLTAECSRKRREKVAAIDTREKAERYIAEVRQKIRTAFGTLPAERCDLKPVVEWTREQEGILVEGVRYQSRPGYHVTAILCRPLDGSKPVPGVVSPCGHNLEGKAAPIYQTYAINLAKKGMAVLVYDPEGQGERKQFLDTPGADEFKSGNCNEHNMIGKQLLAGNDFFGSWRLWDGIRSVDYLLSRPEIDPARISITGNSGGGTLTSYIYAFDERISMAAPGCYITTFQRNYDNELPVDAEQVPPGLWGAGCDMADFLIARAPNPVLILAQKNDFFDPRGAAEAFADLQQIYRLFGAEEKCRLFVGPEGHGYGPDNRRATYEFFTLHHLGKIDAEEADVKTLSRAEVLVTKTGRVIDLPGERTVPSLLKEFAEKLAAGRHPAKEALPELLRQGLKLGALPAAAPEFRVLRNDRSPAGSASCFAVATEPGIEAMLHLLDKDTYFHLPTGKRCTLYVSHLDAESELLAGIPEIADPGEHLFALDVRGIGKSAPLTSDREDCYFRFYGRDYFYDSTATLLGRSYPGGKVFDVLRVLALLRRAGYTEITLAGRGLGALIAAYAAGAGTPPEHIRLLNAPLSFTEMMKRSVFRWPQSHLYRGMLVSLDLPDLYRMLAEKSDFALINPWDDHFRPFSLEALDRELDATGLRDLLTV